MKKITELNRYRTDRFPLDADPDDLYKRDMILDTGGGSDY